MQFFPNQRQRQQSRRYYIIFMSVLVLSIAIDIDWVNSNYYPPSLDKKSSAYGEFDFPLHFSNTRFMTHSAICFNILLKCIVVYTISNKTRSGGKLKRALWKRLHLFCPPTTRRLPKNLKKVVQQRIFSIVWIEILCAIAILVLFGIVQGTIPWATQFSVNCPFIPLSMVMLLKGCSSLVFASSLLFNADILDFFAEYGCMVPKTWYKNRQRIMKKKNSFEFPRVFFDQKYLILNGCVKVIDLTIGILMWVALVWANNLAGGTAPKDIRTILTILFITQVLTELLVTSLCVTAYW